MMHFANSPNAALVVPRRVLRLVFVHRADASTQPQYTKLLHGKSRLSRLRLFCAEMILKMYKMDWHFDWEQYERGCWDKLDERQRLLRHFWTQHSEILRDKISGAEINILLYLFLSFSKSYWVFAESLLSHCWDTTKSFLSFFLGHRWVIDSFNTLLRHFLFYQIIQIIDCWDITETLLRTL